MMIEKQVRGANPEREEAANSGATLTSQINTYIERVLLEYDVNPRCPQILRHLATNWPEEFVLAAISHLDSEEDSRALRLTTLCVLELPCISDILLNPEWPLARAVRLVKRFVAVDPLFDVRLVRRLPGIAESDPGMVLDLGRSLRVFDILEQTSPDRRLVPLIRGLINSPVPQIAAKATLFVGRRIQNIEWVRRQLQSADNRVRANAVESLWGFPADQGKALLLECAQDPCNRVAGNALVGLTILDCPGTMELITNMAFRAETAFRMTAAWCIGQLANPAYLSVLELLQNDTDLLVRNAARTAAGKVPKPATVLPRADHPVELPVAGLALRSVSEPAGSRVNSEAHQPQPSVAERPARQFWNL